MGMTTGLVSGRACFALSVISLMPLFRGAHDPCVEQLTRVLKWSWFEI